MDYIETIQEKTEINNKNLLNWIGISKSKYYYWKENDLIPDKEKLNIPKRHWLLDWERTAIIEYALENRGEGYRRLTYMMLDENVVAVSPSSVYRVLKRAGLLNKWNTVSKSKKGSGFHQPTSFNEHWHTDIKYVNYKGTFLFLITIFDGYSRYVVHHDLRLHMQETDIEIVLQGAIEKYPSAKPRIISDNGRQYISKDFASYLRTLELQHIKTSIMYPQSNGKIERYHRNISSECLSKKSFINLEDARKQIAEYVEFYNTKRLHSALNYLTPEDYVKGRVDERLNEREQKLLMAKKLRYSVKNAS
jgi:putative transposase